ncbi:3'(2'),5'-bisphosphate nucleotidase 1 [Thelohanellus kitauei]|uniref:3'(2'),5'-bisphosphate nucleotidase 1 n=1 Tax=Thelohanellus kitauei TaxID=669202 RepID=A0A0C2MT88_THEKT|nr:3'(2'),5'-bisphosphate nucleotidase 1 [Thelohanellus kitauei]
MSAEFVRAPFLTRLVSLCVSSSETAGKLISQIASSGNLKLINKSLTGRFDPQTEADRLSQTCIRKTLLSSFPDLNIICEEENIEDELDDGIIESIQPDSVVLHSECPKEFMNLSEKDVVVWVDPLDGTMGFVKSNFHQVVVSIGIATQGKAIAGILHQPMCCDRGAGEPKSAYDYSKSYPRTVWGIVGSDIHGLIPRERFRLANSVLLLSESHHNVRDQNIAKKLALCTIIQCSGAAYKGLCILEDEADVMVYSSPGTKKWDTCAIDALFKIKGGIVSDLHGHNLDYNSTATFANTGGIFLTLKHHEAYINKIKEIL